MTIVPHHISVDGHYYSLNYLYEEIGMDVPDDWDRDIIIRPIDVDDPCMGLYRRAKVPDGAVEGADLSGYSDSTEKIAKAVMGTFDNIANQSSLSWYKPLEPTKIAEAIERVSWRSSVTNVATELLSNLILAHGLPNANHRTSIAMLDFYLESIGTMPRSPRTVEEDEWTSWANGFIQRSKICTTLRRKGDLFKRLSERGATGVSLKQELTINFSRYPVDIPDAWSRYENRHEICCRRFVNRYLNIAGAANLKTRDDAGQRAFADRL